MKKTTLKALRRFLCYCLTMALILSPVFSVFAADEDPEGQNTEDGKVNELSIQDTSPAQLSASPESVEPNSPEPVVEVTAEAASEKAEAPAVEVAPESASEEAAAYAVEDTPEATPLHNTDADNETESTETDAVSEDTASLVQTSGYSNTASGRTLAAAEPSADINNNAGESSSSSQIHIGDASFSSEDDESSHWSEGKGWKNVPGKYIAMVDYDGEAAEISADGGEVTLAVAGVNRIGKLTGNCSYRISGTGIVLIDGIEIEDGNTITLHPDSTLYEEGSAAVFLRQDDGSYKLINGGITGILDETYELDNLNLVLPEGSSLTISVAGVRTEVWGDENGEHEDVTFYLTDLPYDANDPSHPAGHVEITRYIGNVVLGKNSTLTIDENASVQMKKMETGFDSIEAELIVKGALNVLGVLEGGFTDVSGSGSITGNGTIRSAELNLSPDGTISPELLLDKSGLTINGNRTIIPPNLKDSIIYLKGSDMTIPELNASGVSRIGVNTNEDPARPNRYIVSDITVNSGGSLEIFCNDHIYADDLYSRLVEDSCLEINGNITGGPVYVLGGSVRYTGNKTDKLPVVPYGYASRVFVDGVDAAASIYPFNMTANKAAELAESDTIPFMRLSVSDSLISRSIMGRDWIVTMSQDLEPIDREKEKDQEFTCASFLEHYGLSGNLSPLTYFTAVELIRSDLTRERFFLDDRAIFDLNDAIMVRVLDCMGKGGQGGSAATHTNAAFTGNGVIGGPGSGSVKAGKGTVVFEKTSYVAPDPTPDPKPNDDKNNTKPSDNKENNNNTKPSDNKENNNNTKPSDNKENNNDTKPSDNKENNNNTKPSDNKENNSNTKPSDNKENSNDTKSPDNNTENNNDIKSQDNNAENYGNTKLSDNKENDSDTKLSDNAGNVINRLKSKSVKAPVSSVNADGLVVTISPVDQNTEEQNQADPKSPQIWRLDVTREGVPVTDMTGNPVRAVFPFDLPESWGDPAKIADNSLYAVFADENGSLTAYSAEYDPETGEVSFEPEQTGYFVIVQFEYGDKPFTYDFYRALADLEEIRLFLKFLKG